MATPSLKATFNKSTGFFDFQDVTDWAGQGISTADINGNIEVIAPDGSVLYNNTLTIPTAITGTAQGGTTTNITLAAGSSAVTDFFKNYYILATGGTGVGQVARISAYNGTTKVATFVTAVGVAFDATTTYKFVRNDIFIEANLTNQVPIQLLYVSGTTDLVQGNYTFNYTVYDTNAAQFYTSTLSYNLSFTFPTASITPEVSPFGLFVKATDVTIYAVNGITPSLSRVFTLNYPNTLNPIPSPVTSNSSVVQTSVVYTGGVYGAVLATTATWVMNSLVNIIGLVTAAESIPVEIDNNLCNLQCCLRAALTRLNELQCNGYLNDAATLRQQLILGVGYYIAVQGAIFCGSGQAKVDEYVALFKSALNCDDECSCSDDDEPTLVIPIGSANGTYSFTSSNGSLELTQTTQGVNTIIDYILDPTIQAAIFSSDIVVGVDNIRVTATGSAPNITYSVRGARVEAGSGVGVVQTVVSGITTGYTVQLENLLDSNLGDALTTTTAYETLRTYTLPHDVLADDGDVLRIKAVFEVTPNNDTKRVRIQFEGNTLFLPYIANIGTVKYVQLEVDCVRLSATTIGVMPSFKGLNVVGGVVNDAGLPIYSTPYVVNNLNDDNLTNVITFQGESTVAGDINCVLNQIEIVKS
jgi:hypothetical protein